MQYTFTGALAGVDRRASVRHACVCVCVGVHSMCARCDALGCVCVCFRVRVCVRVRAGVMAKVC